MAQTPNKFLPSMQPNSMPTYADTRTRMHHKNEFRHRPDFVRLKVFAEFIDSYCDWKLKALGRAPETAEESRSCLRTFLRYLQDIRGLDIGPKQVDVRMAEEFRQWNRERGLSVRSIAGLQLNLRLFYKYLVQEGVLLDSPLTRLRMPVRTKRLPRPMSREEIKALFSVFDILVPIELRDLTIFELVYGSGLRIGDVLKLRLKDLVLEDALLGPHLRMWTKGKKQMLVPLASASLSVLKFFLSRRAKTYVGDFLFSPDRSKGRRPIDVCSMNTRWKIYLMRAGLELRHTVYALRHSNATHLVENGMTIELVQQHLGHEKLSTTQIYTFISPERQFDVHSKANIRDTVAQFIIA